MSVPAPAARGAGPAPLTLAVLAVLAVSIGAAESLPSPVLPLIQHELRLTPSQAGLLSTTLLLAASVSLPITAKLADMYSGRRILLGLAWCIAIGGAVSAFAGSLQVMLLGQFLQGIGGGILPVAFVLLRGPSSERISTSVGVVTGFFTVGGGVGILVAGPLADTLSRRWMFLVPALIVTVVVVVAHIVIPQDIVRKRSTTAVDWRGALLLAAALGTLMYNLSKIPVNGWKSQTTLTLFAATFVVGVAWVLVERGCADPIVDLRMLRRPGVWSCSVAAGIMGAGYAVPNFLIPQLLAIPSVTGYGFGASATDISLYMFPGIVVASVAGPFAGMLVPKLGSRVVICGGLILTAVGLAAATVLHSQPWQIVLILLMTTGLGVGTASTALYIGVIDSVEPAETGVATAVTSVVRGIGASLGVQLTAAIITASANNTTHLPTEAGFQKTFVLSSVVVLLPLAMVGFMPGTRRASAPSRKETVTA